MFRKSGRMSKGRRPASSTVPREGNYQASRSPPKILSVKVSTIVRGLDESCTSVHATRIPQDGPRLKQACENHADEFFPSCMTNSGDRMNYLS